MNLFSSTTFFIIPRNFFSNSLFLLPILCRLPACLADSFPSRLTEQKWNSAKAVTMALGLMISVSYGQNRKIDSLKQVLGRSVEDTIKVQLLNSLGTEYTGINPDTAILLGNQALQLAVRLGWQEGRASSNHNLAVYNRVKGDYALSLEHYMSALELWEQLQRKFPGRTDYRRRKLNTVGNIGLIYAEQANFPKALNFYYKALRMAEELNDKNGIARNLGNIGGVYSRQGNNEKAIDHLARALEIFKSLGEKNKIGAMLSNIGGMYEGMGNHERALDYSRQALKIFEELGDQVNIAFALGNIGNVYKEMGQYPEALAHYNRAMKIKEELGDKNGIAVQSGNIGALYVATGEFGKAEAYLQRALTIDIRIGSLEGQQTRYKFLSELYGKTSRYREALAAFKKHVTLRDSIASEENTRKQTQTELQYEFDKKITADSIKNKEARNLEELRHQQEISSQKNYSYAGIGGFFVMVIVAGISYSAFRNKKKANEEIARQKAIVEEKQKEILDSIYYARRIQNALLTSEKYIARKLTEIKKV